MNSKVSYEPTIYYGRGITAGQPTQSRQTGSNMAGAEARSDVKIHGLWKTWSDCILDIRITDTDAKSYRNITLGKVSERMAKVKKDKYLIPCLERHCTFMLLVYSVNCLAHNQALAFEKLVASLVATK